MPPEKEPAPAKADAQAPTPAPATDAPKKTLLSAVELRRKEMERRNARRTHKPNLKTIPWKK